ncbi:VIT and VWA domain-containing protein [uncultured Roseobacter sp.]|uniref:VIT and vWA domain-containing protein n=1 Tax=uncultured Roseobacter sp. TaxID=114847 RepID=UPI00261989CE|nr:VIT and VWA domain-containing protein [uncultured Roseobacter sp.]
MRHSLLALLCALFSLTSAPVARALTPDDMGGHVIGSLGGEAFLLPMLHSDIAVSIEGDVATVEITQTFVNDAQLPIEAEYLFPLNQSAAIYGMEMVVGDDIVTAVIQEKAQAEATFEEAAEAGKAAALLTQHRPNMFTQRIANLMPGLPIEVTLRYVQMVPKIDGQQELVIPLVVGPRYKGSPEAAETAAIATEESAALPVNTWTIADVPDHPPVFGLEIPETFRAERVSLDLKMISGISVADFGSATHPLTVERTENGLTAAFSDARVLDNKDLVIRYKLGRATLEAASLSHVDERGGFLSLMVEPPALPDDAMITPRELVFVLDTSGSMNGAPMEASKVFMDRALQGLREDDYFRIIPFSDTTRTYSAEAQPATGRNVRQARDYVRRLSAGGGTEIDKAIRTALATEQPADTLRIVVFLSDGYIGDEAQVLRTIHRQIGDARIYAFGIGSSVNRYLLDAMTQEGRGYTRYVPVGEKANDVAETLAADLKTPLLTDIHIDWGDLEVSDVTPSRIPDLFAGQGLRVYARHNGPDTAQIMVKGLVQGRAAEMPVALSLTHNEQAAGLPLVWARNRIATLTRDVALGRDNAQAANAEITRLGLAFSLQTQNTSFVAVSRQKVNTTGQAATPASVPLPIPAGVPVTAFQGGFSGASTPEPQTIFGFLIVLVMSLISLRRRIASAGWFWTKRCAEVQRHP